MVCARYLPDLGGIETHINEVARRIADRDNFEVTILATDRTRMRPRKEVLDGVQILRVPAWPREKDYYFAPQISSIVRQRDSWDVIHCQGVHTPVPLLAMRAARKACIPYVVTFHTGGHSLRHRNALRSLQWRFIGPQLRNAAALIGVSHFEADAISRQARLNGRTVSVIRNGGTLPAPPNEVRAIPGRIITCGRLEKYKGHHRVIQALPYVIKDVPEAHVVVVGSGSYESELRALADQLGVSDKVSFRQLPPEDRAAMAETLAQASVVAALSDYEAHPVAVMEALSVGCPVVGYDTSGIGDLVSEGWVRGVRPGSTSATVAQCLIQSMSSPPLVEIAELPTWDDCAEQLMQQYIEAVGAVTVPCAGSQHGISPLGDSEPRA